MWFVRARCGTYDESFVGMGETPEMAWEDLETQCSPSRDSSLEWWKGKPAKVKVKTVTTFEAE